MPTLASLFEARYLADADFAGIRLHVTGADLACRALGARAFSVGPDVYFADGAFRPDTPAGLWLLAHEVAHVAQSPAPAREVGAAGAPEERCADAAADAFVGGRSVVIEPARPLVRRYMAWEHALLGDLGPEEIGDGDRIEAYCGLLAELGRDPRRVDEERIRAEFGAETVRLPASGVVVTLGELNVLPDYLGHPDAIEGAPAGFIEPLVQSVRSWSITELLRSAGRRAPRRLLPGAMRYPLLGGLAESAEVPAVDALGKRCGLGPSHRYSSVLARNAGHFAPFSWYRWRSFHLAARAFTERAAGASGAEREELRRRALIYAGYADHFLQDSFAAGHQVNKMLVMQWYIEWLLREGASFPGREVLAGLTQERQPLLHGGNHYQRPLTGDAMAAGERAGAVPEPPWDPQDVAEVADVAERIVVSGVVGSGDAGRRAAYEAYLTMLGSTTVQLSTKVAHDYFNKRSLVVAAGPDEPRVRLFGDNSLFAGEEGAVRAAQASAASRRAIAGLLRDGETSASSWEIFAGFPGWVEADAGLVSLADWHAGELRELCFGELFGRWSTRAGRLFVSNAFGQLGAREGER